VEELTVIAATSGDPAMLAQPARRALASLDRRFDPFTVTTFEDLVRFSTSEYQSAAVLVSALGVVALMLTAIGLYGIVSFNVRQRTREIGIRAALGAGRRETIALVLRDVAEFGDVGMAIGLPCAVAAGVAARSLLFGVAPWDPLACLCACLALAAVLAIAGFAPAHRATRIDPMAALRDE
jgi:putative ABC transport system permease protein